MRPVHILLLGAAWLGASAMASQVGAQPVTKSPTIVLVHGAFAGSSSWNGVVSRLRKDGYPVIAAANPLRGLKTDAAYVGQIVHSVSGPVVLVGHSYGGSVAAMAASGQPNVKSLVFVAGFAPLAGESAASLGQQFPTGTLGQALAPPVPLSDGSRDLYIDQTKYWAQFAADVPQRAAVGMSVTQRPITEGALGEGAERDTPSAIPSWFIWGSDDRNIPKSLHAFMAKRANAREAIEVKGASHVVMISHATEVAAMIERAATAP